MAKSLSVKYPANQIMINNKVYAIVVSLWRDITNEMYISKSSVSKLLSRKRSERTSTNDELNQEPYKRQHIPCIDLIDSKDGC